MEAACRWTSACQSNACTQSALTMIVNIDAGQIDIITWQQHSNWLGRPIEELCRPPACLLHAEQPCPGPQHLACVWNLIGP